MAIKVSGTEVISDTRQLTNVTGVDQNTKDTLIAAGVGAQGVTLEGKLSGRINYTTKNPNSDGGSADDNFGVRTTDYGASRPIDSDEANDHLVVGAPDADDPLSQSGKAYLFRASTGELLHTFTVPTGSDGSSASDYFGTSVAVENDYVAISAPYMGIGTGVVYVYSATTGSLLYTINNPDAQQSSYFGGSMAMKGGLIVVGAHNDSTSGGKVYVFNASNGSAAFDPISNPNTEPTSIYDKFGYEVDVSDNYIAASAREEDVGGTSSGTVYVFSRSTGGLVYTFNNPNAYSTPVFDQFGFSISITSQYLAVSAIGEDGPSGSSSGVVYIYDLATGLLTQTLDNPDIVTSTNDQFGYAVSMGGEYVAVSAKSEEILVDGALQYTAGAVYLFNVTTGILDKAIQYSSYGTYSSDQFGGYVCLGNKYLFGSAEFEDDATGYSVNALHCFYAVEDTNTFSTPIETPYLKAGGIGYPTQDGTSGQLLSTDGSGNLSFATVNSVSRLKDLPDVLESFDFVSSAGVVSTFNDPLVVYNSYGFSKIYVYLTDSETTVYAAELVMYTTDNGTNFAVTSPTVHYNANSWTVTFSVVVPEATPFLGITIAEQGGVSAYAKAFCINQYL